MVAKFVIFAERKSDRALDIYQNKSRWKIWLALGGLLIVLASSAYTFYLTRQLGVQEERQAGYVLRAMENINRTDFPPECFDYFDPTLESNIIIDNDQVPVMIVNQDGSVREGRNFGNLDSVQLVRELARMRREGAPVIHGDLYSVYFQNSNLLRQLRWFPLVQFLLIAAFIAIGYLAFSSARRSEQNRVWVGMAKETAHQLGTPTSGIVGWIEHLKMTRAEDEEIQEIAHELERDVNRLQLVAERFSKIGAKPELQRTDIYAAVEKIRHYMAPRAPRKVQFEYPDPAAGPLYVDINPGLFDWVAENLLRNALDATGRAGTLSAEIYADDHFVYVDFSDTGKGIPPNKLKTVFQPGYSTKKRGWGLGLSLAKRIVEEYHSGKIFVKKSEVGRGTTFTIQLPKPSLSPASTEPVNNT